MYAAFSYGQNRTETKESKVARMSTRIIAEFENIDSAETAARLIRYRINDVHAVRLNSREETTMYAEAT